MEWGWNGVEESLKVDLNGGNGGVRKLVGGKLGAQEDIADIHVEGERDGGGGGIVEATDEASAVGVEHGKDGLEVGIG